MSSTITIVINQLFSHLRLFSHFDSFDCLVRIWWPPPGSWPPFLCHAFGFKPLYLYIIYAIASVCASDSYLPLLLRNNQSSQETIYSKTSSYQQWLWSGTCMNRSAQNLGNHTNFVQKSTFAQRTENTWLGSETKFSRIKKNKASLTQEVIPFCVQVGLIGEAPTHDVETVVLAGLQCHLASTIRAV